MILVNGEGRQHHKRGMRTEIPRLDTEYGIEMYSAIPGDLLHIENKRL